MTKQLATFLSRNIGLILSLGLSLNAISASFQNLDFELAKPRVQPGTSFVPIGTALPGWSGYLGDHQQTEVLYHADTTGAVAIELRDDSQGGPGQGRYGVYLISGGSPDGFGGPLTASLHQVGDVPAEAKTLLFQSDTWVTEPNLDFRVTLGGVSLSLQTVTDGTFGADISAFAGGTLDLGFQANYRADRAFPPV